MNDQPAPSRVEQPPSLVRVASDELLLLGARLHDDVALGVLYDRYGTEVHATTFDALRQTDAAEAAMHDVFLRIWRGVEMYDASYGTTHDWLIGIARNRAIDALTKLEPFGGVPDRLMGLDDRGLLAPPEPASGARERLLARARAESSGVRAAEAPTVVLPFAELGPEVTPPPEVEPTLVSESTSDLTLGPEPESASTAMAMPEVAVTSGSALTTGAELVPGGPPTIGAELASEDPASSETVIASEGRPTLEVERTEEDRPALAAELAHVEPPTFEVELAQKEQPIEEAAITSEDRPIPEAELVLEERPSSEEELASEAPTLTGLPILGPPTPNGQYTIVPDEVVTQPTPEPDEVTTPYAVAPEEPVTQEVMLPQEAVTQEAVMVTEPADPPTATPPERRLAELEPSEALAVALAPIQPRRTQQPRHAAPEAPGKRGVKLATIGWGAALLFVVASGLAVATWSATGPHVSPDLNVLSRLPGGRVVTLRGTGTPTASARLHSVDSGRRSELAVDSLPPLPTGRVYQVWLLEPNQQARSAGAFLVNRRGDAVVPVNIGGPVERLQALAVTQEPAPGAAAPTGLRVLEGAP